MATSQQQVQTYLELAHEFAARVADNADRMDADRQLPSELSADMADKGFFACCCPLSGRRRVGPSRFSGNSPCVRRSGRQRRLVSQPEQCFYHRLGQNAQRDGPGGLERATGGGQQRPPQCLRYRNAGRGRLQAHRPMAFSTGYDHATWVAALTPVGQPAQGTVPGPLRRTGGSCLSPRTKSPWLTAGNVQGLRGTGSFGFDVNDLFVPYLRSYDQDDPPWETGPLYVIPRTLLFSTGFATSALAVARSALTTAIESYPGTRRNERRPGCPTCLPPREPLGRLKPLGGPPGLP